VISAAGLADPEQLATATFGAGAYVLDASSTVSGDRYTFVKNDEYWNPDAQHYDTFVVRVIGDAQTALSALRTGQIDVNTNTTPTQVPDAESADGIEVVAGTPTSIVVWLLDREGQVTSAIGDEKVRQALNYAIDRDAIATALGPLYAPLGQLLPEGAIGHDPALEDAYPYDVDKAKALLDEAGYGDGFTLAFSTNTDNRGAEVSQILVEQWAKIGVTAELTVYNNQPGEMFGAIADGKTAAQTFAFTASLLRQQSLLTQESVFNPFGLSSAAVDDAYAALLAAPEADVDAAAQQISAAISQEAWFVPVAAVDSFVFYSGIDDFGDIGADGARVLDVLNWTPSS
jgi:peptide/nickel transport system substrate-binding protein